MIYGLYLVIMGAIAIILWWNVLRDYFWEEVIIFSVLFFYFLARWIDDETRKKHDTDNH